MKLFNGDCLDIIRTLEPNSVDLVFLDLPYGQTNCEWGDKIGLNEVAVGLILPGLIAKVFQYIIGNRKAELYALKGKLINSEEARKIGLIDDIVDPDHILDEAVKEMKSWLKLPNYQQGLTKLKLRADIIEEVLWTYMVDGND